MWGPYSDIHAAADLGGLGACPHSEFLKYERNLSVIIANNVLSTKYIPPSREIDTTL